MKKTFFYLSMALCVAICNISCGSDDDGDTPAPENTPVTLPEPKFSTEAVEFTIPDNSVPASEGEASLTALNFTESGKAIIEVKLADGAKKYVTYNVRLENDAYIITDQTGKKVGEVKDAATKGLTRGTSTTNLVITLTVVIPGVGEFSFTPETPTAAQKVVETIAATTGTTNIARTWTVQQMKLTLEGDVSASLIEKSGNLKILADEAQDRGADLTKDELEELNKVIKGITLDKTGLFSIEYNNTTEACSWKWTDANQTKLQLQFGDSEFGNRFLSDNSNIEVKFFTTGVCHFTLTTDIKTSSKKYKATLLLEMKS